MNPVDSAVVLQGVSKRYGAKLALDRLDLTIAPGRIVGLLGPNGSGKTTTMNALLGLVDFEGRVSVLGHDPRVARHRVFEDVCYLADVAILPRWARVHQLLAHVQSVHPRFNRSRAEQLLAKTNVKLTDRVGTLSKGMVAQVHLALALAINARLMVLDEPTLGLDVFSRKTFYKTLVEDYFDEEKTIVIASHQVEEIQGLLTDVVLLHGGQKKLDASMEEVEARFTQVLVDPACVERALLHRPKAHQVVLGRHTMLFDGVSKTELATLGQVQVPALSDVFMAVCEEKAQ